MSMTKKHFTAIANAIREEIETLTEEKATGLDRSHHIVGAQLVARRIAGELRQFNPNFDRSRFLAACGIED